MSTLIDHLRMYVRCDNCGAESDDADYVSMGLAAEQFTKEGWTVVNSEVRCGDCKA
jgi:hypothetical protein